MVCWVARLTISRYSAVFLTWLHRDEKTVNLLGMAKASAKVVNVEQPPLFIADHRERNPRCIQDIMAYPYFSLAKRKRVAPLVFSSPANDIEITVHGLPDYGLASIYDADILLWLTAEIRRHYEKGGLIERKVHFNPRTMLNQIGKAKGGRQIDTLKNALIRLSTNFVHTTVRTEHQKQEGGFHWIDNWTTATDQDGEEPTGLWSATLNEWLVQGIVQDNNILTLNPAYYRLTSGLEKRLYQIARKHAGKQAHGTFITMVALHAKAGSGDTLKQFAYEVRCMAREKGCILDYNLKVSYHDDVEKVWFRHESFAQKTEI